LHPVLGVPKEKVASFTVVIVVIYAILAVVIAGFAAGLLFSTSIGNPMTGGTLSGA
jgi:hypothetical protein